MATPKLVYVNSRGRAELIRFIFAYQGVEYTDERVEFADLKAALAATPIGIIPTLQVDDKTISGTMTISRYIAEKYECAGTNALENAEISSIVESVDDVWIKLIAHFFEKDETIKERLYKQITEQFLPGKLAMLEKIASASTAPEKWIYGGKLTYADFSIFTLIDSVKIEVPGICKTFPALETLCNSVSSLPAIQKWLETRPNTPF